MVFLLSVPLLISPAAAWSPQTHYDIASKVYYSLPLSVQHNLNLSELKRGAIAPDAVFKDFTDHQYSRSVPKAQQWLNNGKAAYKSKNYKYASYCYGVAIHYISDSFAAPHCIYGESAAQHKAYENQATGMKPTIKYTSGSLKSLLSSGYYQGNTDWRLWILGTRSPSISQRDLNSAGSVAYSMVRNCV